MYCLSKFCCICLEVNAKLVNLTTIKHEDATIFNIIKEILPQMESQLDSVLLICNKCRDTFEYMDRFTNMCIKNNQILIKYISMLSSNGETVGNGQIILIDMIRNNVNALQTTIDINTKEEIISDEEFNIEIDIEEWMKDEDNFDDYIVTNGEAERSVFDDTLEKNVSDEENDNIPSNPPVDIQEIVSSNDESNNDVTHTTEASDTTKQKTQFACNVCNKVYTLQRNYRRHCLIHDETSFQCQICERRFRLSRNFKQHVLTHGNTDNTSDTNDGKKIKCQLCGVAFYKLDSYKQHMTGHDKIQDYVCQICNKPFSVFHDLQTHISTHTVADCVTHDKPLDVETKKTHTCDLCNETFTDLDDLNRHSRGHDTRDRSFKCAICSKTFFNLKNLKDHASIHIEGPFVCTVCHRNFSKMRYLKYHILTHTTHKKFTCEFCNESFGRPSTLRQHRFVHIQGERYVCNLCKKSFKHRRSMKYHMCINSRPKPFKCNRCYKSFQKECNLKIHEQKHSRTRETIRETENSDDDSIVCVDCAGVSCLKCNSKEKNTSPDESEDIIIVL